MLQRLKILDPDGRVSLTNVALYIVLGAFMYSVGRSGGVPIEALGALLTALAAYRVKTWQLDSTSAADAERADRAVARDVEALRAELDSAHKELDRVSRTQTAQGRPAPLPPGLR